MSGGSFNYLYSADATELFSFQKELREMADELTNRGFKDAATETERILAYLEHAERQIQVRADRLSDIWKAVEWHCSNDYGSAQVEEAIKKYRAE
jgi:hypothetical protein